MDSKQIRFLLDQYFEGKTTRKEELLLQRFYIENQNLDTDLEKFRALFLYYNQAQVSTSSRLVSQTHRFH